jgi:peptidoglycan/LPS O-acetylase OafA/YrhL
LPRAYRGKPGWANGLLEFAYVTLLFPLIILMGAHSRMSAGTRKIAKALGRLSYPLYIIHYPFIYWYWDLALDPRPHDLMIWAPVLYAGSIALGWAALRLWDEPLRRWATARWIAKEN